MPTGMSAPASGCPKWQVPLATYTGWNFRDAASGGSDALRPLTGSEIPFPTTAAARQVSRDPRRAVAERYPDQDVYLTRIRTAEAALVKSRYILVEDVPAIEARAMEHWRLVSGAAATATR